MVRDVRQSASIESKLDIYIHRENPGDRIAFNREKGKGVFDYTHERDLPIETAEKAFKYIKAIVDGNGTPEHPGYPYQLRHTMALPLWDRFQTEWCASGDEGKALRAI